MKPQELVSPFSRLLMSAIFISAGLSKIQQREGTLQYMKSKNVPFAPVALPVAAATEIIGGTSLLSGYRGRYGALALAAFLVPTSLLMHDFWKLEAGMERQTQQINFLKNLALIGGLLAIASAGTGSFSLDQGVEKLSEWRERARSLPEAA
jgi:putative oxidoreductase